MEKVALIDADSLLYYEMGKPTLEEAMESIDIRIEQILNFAGTTKYRGFLTLGKCFRYDIAKTKPYKYNRKGGTPKPPIFYALKGCAVMFISLVNIYVNQGANRTISKLKTIKGEIVQQIEKIESILILDFMLAQRASGIEPNLIETIKEKHYA